ncbi:MAG: methyltransferase domain-containing protein [Methanobacteriaceae archaeon]|jgi:ubiquinone/menaquinone biosynthesis C-methylase UbiE
MWGGAGLILNGISTHIKERYGIRVNKFALDLSPGMLEIQKKINPDLKTALNEDIRKTSLGNKEIDLTLMIDVLEHIPNSAEALEELKRISKFVIFKVPLEDNLLDKTLNSITRGKSRQQVIETVGHINVYNFKTLKYQISEHTGQVLDSYFTNVFKYVLNSEHYRNIVLCKCFYTMIVII